MDREAEVQAAIAHYHELLDGGHWQSTHELVTAGGRERQVRLFGKSLITVLRPHFMSPARYAAMQQASLLVGRAIAELGDRIIADEELRRRLLLTPEEEERVTIERRPVEPYARLDGFLGDDGTIRFLEYNTVPFGTRSSDQIAQIFESLPIMAAFRERYRARYLRTEELRIPACLRAHQLRGGDGKPQVAVVATLGSGTLDAGSQIDAESLFLLHGAMAAGIPVQLVEPDTLEYRDGRLRSGDFVIDCITYIDDYTVFLKAFPLAHPLWQAVRDGAAFFLGSFALIAVRGNKAAFALLSEPEIAAMFTPEVRAAVERHVLWTRLVREGRTDLRGQSIDLVPYVAAHRERFVLKPTNLSSGRGIVLGWECDAAAWEAALERALATPHVVQERAAPSHSTYPLVAEGRLHMVEHNEDCNPFVWNSESVEGCFMRLSTSGMMNLSLADGTLAPLFLVESAAG